MPLGQLSWWVVVFLAKDLICKGATFSCELQKGSKRSKTFAPKRAAEVQYLHASASKTWWRHSHILRMKTREFSQTLILFPIQPHLRDSRPSETSRSVTVSKTVKRHLTVCGGEGWGGWVAGFKSRSSYLPKPAVLHWTTHTHTTQVSLFNCHSVNSLLSKLGYLLSARHSQMNATWPESLNYTINSS